MKLEEKLKRFIRDTPVFFTERLCFRPICEKDAPDMFEYARRPEVSRYLLWSPHPDLAYTKKYIGCLSDAYKKGLYYDWAVVERRENKMIGTGGFAMIDPKNRAVEIGYVLSSDYWHRGYGTEIARELICFAFSYFGVHRVQARYMIGNTHSRDVMDKCGMTFEGVNRGALYVKEQYRDIGVCSILYDDYAAKNPLKRYDEAKKKRYLFT